MFFDSSCIFKEEFKYTRLLFLCTKCRIYIFLSILLHISLDTLKIHLGNIST